MSKILVIPDVHGRDFWRSACSDPEKFDNIIFLGDYMDPYDFENIGVEKALNNFKDIIEFAKENPEKTVLLLGNHDMPYYSEYYKSLSWYHCRYSHFFAKDIKKVFKENNELFNIAYTQDDILFTHAGCSSDWLEFLFTQHYKIEKTGDFLEDLVLTLNSLLDSKDGIKTLFKIGYERGGNDRFASCVWADVSELQWDQDLMKNPNVPVKEIQREKQVFGHTLQGMIKKGEFISPEDPIEFGNCKMMDVRSAFELDTETFTAKRII